LAIENRDARSYKQYLASRPKNWEDDAIAMMIRLCEKYACRVHIVHLSSADSIEQIVSAKAKGLPLTVETAQHYLYFNAEGIADGQTAFKCAPPIREKANNEQLWQALKQGIIDFVATDHSPAPPSLKQIESGDLVEAWGGIASLQLALPVLWTAAKKHNALLPDIAKWLCVSPALLAGLQNSKGQIAPGCDADFVVWSPEEFFEVNEAGILHKHKTTPYNGETLFGVVKQTYLAGKKVYDCGQFTSLHCGELLLH
jgi:allantoinase